MPACSPKRWLLECHGSYSKLPTWVRAPSVRCFDSRHLVGIPKLPLQTAGCRHKPMLWRICCAPPFSRHFWVFCVCRTCTNQIKSSLWHCAQCMTKAVDVAHVAGGYARMYLGWLCWRFSCAGSSLSCAITGPCGKMYVHARQPTTQAAGHFLLSVAGSLSVAGRGTCNRCAVLSAR